MGGNGVKMWKWDGYCFSEGKKRLEQFMSNRKNIQLARLYKKILYPRLAIIALRGNLSQLFIPTA